MVLGVKLTMSEVDHYRIHIRPAQPISLGDSAVRTISAWVHANNFPHRLFISLLDPDQEPLGLLYLGELNYLGWKNLSAVLPRLPVDRGLYLDGFVLDCGARHVYGYPQYYYYFDRISIVTEDGLQ